MWDLLHKLNFKSSPCRVFLVEKNNTNQPKKEKSNKRKRFKEKSNDIGTRNDIFYKM